MINFYEKIIKYNGAEGKRLRLLVFIDWAIQKNPFRKKNLSQFNLRTLKAFIANTVKTKC